MKRFSVVIFSFFITLFLLSFAPTSYAAGICPPGQFANLCNLTFDGALVGKLINILLVLAVILALIFLIWGGIRWIMSGGDKQKIEQARSAIIGAIVGLVLAFLSFLILNGVIFIITGQSSFGSALVIPTL